MAAISHAPDEEVAAPGLDEVSTPAALADPHGHGVYQRQSLECNNTATSSQAPDAEVAVSGLDEASVPAPLADSHDHGVYHKEFLEDKNNQGGHTQNNLTPRKTRRKPPPPPGKPILDHRPMSDIPETKATSPKQRKSSFAAKPSKAKQVELNSTATKVFVHGHLVLFSILGTLARLGLQALTTYAQAPLPSGLIWANFAGSFIMGYLSETRELFRDEWGPNVRKTPQQKAAEADPVAERKRHSSVKKTIPLYIGLVTGFCGSFTSFSSFQRDVFLNLANSIAFTGRTYPLDRPGGESFMALLAALIITPCLSLAALSAGAHFAVFTERLTPTISFVVMRGLLDPFLSILGLGCWFGAVIMAIWPPDRPHGPANDHHGWERETWRGQVIFALVFAPLGTLTRYYASMALNPRVASFPVGTFAVNTVGTLMETLFFDLQHAPLLGAAIGGGVVSCQVLQGLQDGFCGCLTTVSTWVVELKALRKENAYVYGLVSLLVGLGITTIVMGSLRWTLGFSPPSCVVS